MAGHSTQTSATRHRRRCAAVAAVLLAVLNGGCAVRQLLVNRVGDALAEGGAVYAADPDVELVGAATPFGLKLLESLHAESPRHRGLLLALARGFTQYAYAYVEMPADVLEERDVDGAYAARDRARRLYLRARDYGLRGLDVAHPGWSRRLAASPAAAVAELAHRDTALAYWTATAWGAAIALGKDDAALVATLPAVRALAARALILDDTLDGGAPHVLALSLAMSGPGPAAERVATARSHFERALALSRGSQAAPFVAYAEAVCVATADRAGFESMLARALAVDSDAAPQERLANTLFQRRARWLAGRGDELFSQ